MSGNKPVVRQEKIGKDPIVTALSLAFIAIQSLIIIFGFIYRWDWIVYEFAAMLIIPAIIILYYGIKNTVKAHQIMEMEKSFEEGLD